MSSKRNNEEPLLQVEDLEVVFDNGAGGSAPVVRKISFDLHSGEMLGIVGESGAGKSVVLRALMDLLPARAEVSGSIRLNNQQVIGMGADELRQIRGREISMIFQNPASHLDPLMTIGRQIAEPLIHHEKKSAAEARAAAIQRLEEVQIDRPAQRVDSYPHQLSGGMKQRAMIAAAIACRPQLLLADEPTTALDVTVQARILELLAQLNRDRGLSMILVSHDLAVVAQSCDRILVMKDGEVVDQGQTRDVIAAPGHAYTRELLRSQPNSLTVKLPHTRTAEPLLEISELSVDFALPFSGIPLLGKKKNLKAVNNVSLLLERGESLGIVGESGSGKSTLVRAIMGLNSPRSGDVRLQGQSILGKQAPGSNDFRHRIQMVFQNPFDSLNPRFTVRKMISEPLLIHSLVEKNQVEQRVNELLQLVELDPNLSGRRPGQLSGGQCQRVGIARALAMEPEILIADEITSALDVTIQAQIIALLARLRESAGLSVIFISHDLELVRSFCHRVAVFQAGRIVEIGAIEDVLTNPRQAYTKTLLASAPKTTGRI
jgi:ABC-type glutathione transport system ATPase component